MNRPVLRWRMVALSVAVGAAGACTSPTSTCQEANGVMGTWAYDATQESPLPGSLSGSLVISSQHCTDFQGALDVVEVLATGETRRLVGPVSGTLVDATVARFEVSLGGVGRDHLARIARDSLAGSWVESAGPAPGTGRFGGRRR
ncbi:MAG TPA: hypothetical protein VF981_04985 [Gemmatimonadaceae bacterium]